MFDNKSNVYTGLYSDPFSIVVFIGICVFYFQIFPFFQLHVIYFVHYVICVYVWRSEDNFENEFSPAVVAHQTQLSDLFLAPNPPFLR